MILTGDSLKKLRTLPSESVQCCVTSPPYFGLRDYGVSGQIGLEATPDAFVARLVEVFREVRRCLKNDGVLFLNLGDSYATNVHTGSYGKNADWCSLNSIAGKRIPPGCKPKDLIGIPWMVAFALRADGWYLRSDIIWHKPNPMPESVTDRPTKSHEYMFLLSKSAKYFYDAKAVKEPATSNSLFHGSAAFKSGANGDRNDGGRSQIGIDCGFRNRRSVWTIATRSFKGAHFATFPPKLVEPCILAGSRPGDVVLDPFAGAATVGLVAQQHGREFLGIELNPQYVKIANARLHGERLKLAA